VEVTCGSGCGVGDVVSSPKGSDFSGAVIAGEGVPWGVGGTVATGVGLAVRIFEIIQTKITAIATISTIKPVSDNFAFQLPGSTERILVSSPPHPDCSGCKKLGVFSAVVELSVSSFSTVVSKRAIAPLRIWIVLAFQKG
jgi:hypothetical protein